MKDLLKNGALVILVVAVLYLIFLKECKRPPACPPSGFVLIDLAAWDSIKSLANKPPEIKIKKEYIKGETVYIDRPILVPVVDPQDSTINHYSDSIVNKEINVWHDFSLRGELLTSGWRYNPIKTEITLTKTVYVPQIVEKKVPVPKDGVFLSGSFGGRTGMSFLYGGSLDLITKKGGIYGLQYQRMGGENFYSFRLGAKIQLK
jgi:hypothetical protein